MKAFPVYYGVFALIMWSISGKSSVFYLVSIGLSTLRFLSTE